MKYEEYKKLTPEQKEEYDWKFRNKNSFIDASLPLLIIIAMMITFLVFGEYALLIRNYGELYIAAATKLLINMFNIVNAVLIISTIIYAVQAAYVLWLYCEERAWKKKIMVK